MSLERGMLISLATQEEGAGVNYMQNDAKGFLCRETT